MTGNIRIMRNMGNMRKMAMVAGGKSIFAILLPMMLSCSGNVENELVFNGKDVEFVAMTQETKLSFADDLTQIVWDGGDEISVFDGKSNVRYTTSENGRTARFTSEVGIDDAAKDVYAVYPYDENHSRGRNGVRITLPPLQKVNNPGFDPKASLAVAYSSKLSKRTDLNFETVCSFFKFTVPSEDNVVSVRLSSKDGEYVSGTVNLSFDGKEPVLEVVGGETYIEFESETPMDGIYIIPLLPCVLQNGLAVTLKTQDGRTAVHQVVAKDENGVESAVVFTRNKINRHTLDFKNPSWRNAPEIKVNDFSSTSVSFSWSENGFNSPEADFGIAYRVALYSDAGGNDCVREFDWNVAPMKDVSVPAYCFGGLKPDTDYWLSVEDVEAESASELLKITTSSEDCIVISSEKAEEGQVVLRENFSELSEGADPVHAAWGHVGGSLTSDPSVLGKWNSLNLDGTRLEGWKEKTDGGIYAAPGYVRAGDHEVLKDALLTPVLSNLKECSTVELSFRAAPFSSDYGFCGQSALGECYAEVWVVNGGEMLSAGTVELNDTPDGWTECSVEVHNVLPDSRLAIGGAYGEKTKVQDGRQYARIYLDDIQVKVKKYETYKEVVRPQVECGRTFWSDSYISWKCSGEPEKFRVYVNDALETELGKDVTEYHVSGLPTGTKSKICVSAVYNQDDEGMSEPVYVTTGKISQITKNVSPTSVSVSIENRAGDNTNNNNPCLYVELLDSDNVETARKIFSTYVLDAQIQSPASPFMASLAVNEKKGRAPLNVAFGCLEPGRDYWFRVKSVAEYEFMSYQPAKPATSSCTSSNGDSDFSEPVKVSTAATHTAVAGEVLYEGFDDLMFQADYINCAVGSVPAYKAAGMKVGDMSYDKIRTWQGGWSFYGLRVAFASSQLAPHYAWAKQQTVSDELFTITPETANGTIAGDAPGKGAKLYRFNENAGSLSGWYSSNNTYACQGYINLGAYYNVSDSKAQTLGMIVTPELGGALPETGNRSCELSFRGFVLQGRCCTLAVWRYDSSLKKWSEVDSIPLHNSAGETSVAASYSAQSDTHRWYDYNCTLSLAKGDRIAFVSDKQGAALLDEICIIVK